MCLFLVREGQKKQAEGHYSAVLPMFPRPRLLLSLSSVFLCLRVALSERDGRFKQIRGVDQKAWRLTVDQKRLEGKFVP